MRILILGAALSMLACGGSTVEIGAYEPTTAAEPDGGSPSAKVEPTLVGPKIEVHVRATTAPVPHTDGLSGQTPREQKLGIRKLTLLPQTDGPPYIVFDHGGAPVEAGLSDKDDTLVATVAASTLNAGRYTRARVGVSHVRYRVEAMMHAMGQVVPGVFQNLQVLSDGVTIDNATRNKGHYDFTFEAGGKSLATRSGENGPVPRIPSSGGITLDTSGAESAYEFPVDLAIVRDAGDMKLVFELNTHESFRWQDEGTAGFEGAKFDVTPTTFEPVMSFGANSFRLYAELASAAP